MHDDLYQINTLKHKTVNWLHSLMLLAGMVLLLGLLGWIFAGPSGIRWTVIITVISLIVSPHLSPKVILRWYAAKPLIPHQVPDLYAALQELAQRAGLSRPPVIYYVPTKMLNAFTTGSPDNAAMERYQGGWVARVLFPGYRERQPSIIRTHPQTQERIDRLLTISPGKLEPLGKANAFGDGIFHFTTTPVQVRKNPRWRFGGILY